eukprot:3583051-Rhodomonas_salina.2
MRGSATLVQNVLKRRLAVFDFGSPRGTPDTQYWTGRRLANNTRAGLETQHYTASARDKSQRDLCQYQTFCAARIVLERRRNHMRENAFLVPIVRRFRTLSLEKLVQVSADTVLTDDDWSQHTLGQ